MAWIIVLSVVLLIGILLCFSIRLEVSFKGDQFHYRLRYLFFSLRMKDSVQGKAKEVAPKPQKQAEEKKKKPDVAAFVRVIERFWDILKKSARDVQKRVRIEKLNLSLTIAEEDPAKTAMLYGGACGVIYSASSFVESRFVVRRHDITVRPLFNGGETSIDFACVIAIRLGGFIAVGVLESLKILLFLIKENAAKKTAKDGAYK